MTWRRGSMPAQSQPDSSRAPTGRPTEAQKPEGHLEWIGDFSQVSSIYRPAPSRNLRRKFGGVGRCFLQRVPAGLAPGAGQAPLIRDLTQKATFCRGGCITLSTTSGRSTGQALQLGFCEGPPLRTTLSTSSRRAYSGKREQLLTWSSICSRRMGARIVPQPPFALLEREPNRALAALPFSPG